MNISKHRSSFICVLFFLTLIFTLAIGATVMAADDDGIRYSPEDNCFYYYVDGKIASDVNTVAPFDGSWWVVRDGKVDLDYNGVAENEYGEWYCTDGMVRFDVYSICYCTNKGVTDWWLIRGGKVTYEDTVAGNENGWWYMKNGRVDFTYNGLADNEFGRWLIKDGQVDFSFWGFITDENGDWYLSGGGIQYGMEKVVYGSVNGENGWWYVKDGKVSYTDTIAPNEYGWWKIDNGRVNFGYSGIARNEYGYWLIKYGETQFDANTIVYGTVDGEIAWWLIRGGKVTFETTVAENEDGWWYVEDGKINYQYTGVASNEYGSWYIENGQVQFVTGRKTVEIDGETVIRYVKDGMVLDGDIDKAVTDMSENILNECGWTLYAAYDWTVNNITYKSDASAWTTAESAMYSMQNYRGDCIGFASTFCWLARTLGYECNVLYGDVPYASGGWGDHAWCEIWVDGQYYWVDTQYANQTKKNGYLFHYGDSGTWMYRNWSVLADF